MVRQILFVRMIITTTLCYGYMYWSQTPHFPFGLPEVRWLLLLRGVGGFLGVFGMYCMYSGPHATARLANLHTDSLLYIPLADATVVTFIAPSLSCFACAILLREPFTRMEQLGALISFVGVTLIARPTTFVGGIPGLSAAVDASSDAAPVTTEHKSHSDYSHVTSGQRFIAVCIAVLGALGSAMAFTTMRWIGKRAHPILSVTYFCAFCTVVSALAMIILPGIDFILPSNTKEWSYLIFLGCCGFAMQFLLSAGLQLEKSSRATLMVYTQMLFALIFDKLVFGTNPNLLSLLGSGMILSSAIYIAIQKESIKQKEEARKALELAAAANGRVLEMEDRRSLGGKDEERGLVKGMDGER